MSQVSSWLASGAQANLSHPCGPDHSSTRALDPPDQHGSETTIHAAVRADAMLEGGDLKGRAVWLRVIGAIGELGRGRQHGEALQ